MNSNQVNTENSTIHGNQSIPNYGGCLNNILGSNNNNNVINNGNSIANIQTPQNSVEAFLKSVDVLFHSPDQALKKEANKFLFEFERKAESWDVAYIVLNKKGLSDEAYFNALQILKNKIRYDFGDYNTNPENIKSLLRFLLGQVENFKSQKHFLLLNFAKCISLSLVFTSSSFLQNLQNFIAVLSQPSQQAQQNRLLLLLIFEFLVETAFDSALVLDADQKENFRKNLVAISEGVFGFLCEMVKIVGESEGRDSGGEERNMRTFVKDHVLETVMGYLYLNLTGTSIFQKLTKDFLPLLDFIFKIDEQNSEKQCDIICSLLQLNFDNESFSELGKVIVGRILGFKEKLYKNIMNLDEEEAGFYVEVFSTLIRNNMENLVKENRKDLVQILVDLSKVCPGKKIMEVTEFFINFVEFLHDKGAGYEKIFVSYKVIFYQLIGNLIVKCIYPQSIFPALNSSKKKSVKDSEEYLEVSDFREETSNLLKFFAQNFGFFPFFSEILFPEFVKIAESLKKAPQNLEEWAKFEGILFVFSSICEFAKKDEDKIVGVFEIMLQVPRENVQVVRTITDVLEKKCVTFGRRDIVVKSLQYLTSCLSSPLTLKYASYCAQNLLLNNKETFISLKKDLYFLYSSTILPQILKTPKLFPILKGIVQVICSEVEATDVEKSIKNVSTDSQRYAKDNNSNDNNNTDINNDNNSSRNKSNSEISSVLIEILRPWVMDVTNAQKLIKESGAISPEQQQNLVQILEVLKEITKAAFGGLKAKNVSVMSEIFRELWPKFKTFLEHFGGDGDMAEELIQIIKMYMREMGGGFVEYMEEYCGCILGRYREYPTSSYLYGFEVLITVISNPSEQKTKEFLLSIFTEFCSITLTKYIKSTEDISIHVQLSADFFGLLYRLFKHAPFLIFESKEYDKIIKSSIEFLKTREIEVSKNIVIFLRSIVKFAENNTLKSLSSTDPSLYKVIENKLSFCVNSFIPPLAVEINKIILTAPPIILLENITELLYYMILYFPLSTLEQLKLIFAELGLDILTQKEKDEFLASIKKGTFDRELFENFTDVYVKRCRNRKMREEGREKE